MRRERKGGRIDILEKIRQDKTGERVRGKGKRGMKKERVSK